MRHTQGLVGMRLAYTYAHERPLTALPVASHPQKVTPMTRTVALNALFLVAGGVSFTVEAILYKLALFAIVLLLHAIWMRAIVRRSARDGAINALRGVGLPQATAHRTRSTDRVFGD